MREKVTYDPKTATFETLPTSILAEKIKKTEWGTKIKITSTPDKQGWENAVRTGFVYVNPSIVLSIPYRGRSINIYVEWEFQTRRGRILNQFRIKSFDGMRTRWANGDPRGRVSTSYKGAVERIADLLLSLFDPIDKEIAREQEEERYRRTMELEYQKLANRLGDVRLSHRGEGQIVYHPADSYALTFTIRQDNNLIRIDRIIGEFTEEEIRQIMKIIASSPRCVAERLTK